MEFNTKALQYPPNKDEMYVINTHKKSFGKSNIDEDLIEEVKKQNKVTGEIDDRYKNGGRKSKAGIDNNIYAWACSVKRSYNPQGF